MRWLKAVAAAAAMLLVIGGAPVLLLGWGSLGPGWWRAADGSLLLTVLTVAGWLAWGAFTLATVLEVIRYASGNRFIPDLPLLGGLQTLCAGLVLTVVGAAAGSATSVAPPPPQLATLIERAASGPVAEASDAVGSSALAVEPRVAAHGSSLPETPLETSATTDDTYTVVSGDDLWSVAERLLGDGRRWRELVRVNPELLSDPTTQLTAGTHLKLPGGPAAPTATPKPKTVTVEKGDTLSGLAKEHLGKTGRWPRIAAANADLISDPDHIEIGWELVIPEPPAAKPSTPEIPGQARDDGVGSAVESDSVLSPIQSKAEPLHSDGTEQPPAQSETAGPPEEPLTQGGTTAPPHHRHPGLDPGSQLERAETGPVEATEPRPIPEPSTTSLASPTTIPELVEGSANPESTESPPSAQQPDRALIGSLGALAAAGLMGGWQARRLLQSRVRPPGRRVLPLDDDLARLHAAVGRRRVPDPTATLDAALRTIGQHHHQTGQPLPRLDQVTLLPTGEIRFTWAAPAGPPPVRFEADGSDWVLPAGTRLDAVEHPCAFPALVSLGATEADATVLVDLERSGVLGVASDDRELQLASLASIAVELASAPWAAEVTLVGVGRDAGLARAAGGDTVTCFADPDEALADLRRHQTRRARELQGLDLRRLRTDPERADAVAPRIYVFHDPLPPARQAELDGLLTGSDLGLAAVVLAESQADAQLRLFGDPLRPNARYSALSSTPAGFATVVADPPAIRADLAALPTGSATLPPDVTATVIPAEAGISPSLGIELIAHAIPEGARAAVSSWYRVAEASETEAAPWWSEEDAPNLRLLPTRHPPSEESVDIVSLRRLVPPHPTLALIGPIELNGTAGQEPARARYQLIEMASWLLEHPGRTATQMAAGLGIAETTRRSNLSRLRAWLGNDPDDRPYLPEAYSGRIQLHPEVTSDVARLQLLTGPGVNRIGEDGLIAALDLIRGGLLADAAPSQWYWAESLRSDVAATLRDAGLVLVDRALDRGELDLARWATDRALMVAPEDELLMCARIRTEHAAGNRPGVERHVLRLTQQARALGVDLLPQTVLLCQQVMEGRPRIRRA